MLVRLGWVKRCIRIVPVRLCFVLLRCVSSFSVILDSCERKNRWQSLPRDAPRRNASVVSYTDPGLCASLRILYCRASIGVVTLGRWQLGSCYPILVSLCSATCACFVTIAVATPVVAWPVVAWPASCIVYRCLSSVYSETSFIVGAIGVPMLGIRLPTRIVWRKKGWVRLGYDRFG
jgi:hypothetical protein